MRLVGYEMVDTRLNQSCKSGRARRKFEEHVRKTHPFEDGNLEDINPEETKLEETNLEEANPVENNPEETNPEETNTGVVAYNTGVVANTGSKAKN